MATFEAQMAADYFYRRGRRQSSARQALLLAFAIAPLVLYQESDATLYVAIAATAWTAVELFVLRRTERSHTLRGATCQEVFDTELFEMPWNPILVRRLPADTIRHAASKSKLSEEDPQDWYDASTGSNAGVQACQAESPRWSVNIQQRFAATLLFVATVVLGLGIALGINDELTLSQYLTKIAVPSLPALLAVVNLVDRHWQAVDGWRNVERAVAEEESPTEDRLRRQQDLIYLARVTYPLVPRWFFKLNRRGLKHG